MTRSTIADGLFVVALILYVLAGIPAAPIHADEFMQMSMARDVFYLAQGNLERVRFAPPVLPDTEQHLRLLNGPLNKDMIGFVWALDGRDPSSLPGIFAWAMSLDWNAAHGNVPDAPSLDLARLPSTLLTALGVLAIFGLAMRIAGRPMAYPAALLYTLHPVILLNGRRAMMEGGLLLFSIVLIGVTIWISKRYASSTQYEFSARQGFDFALVGICAGLTIAAKHTGLIVVAAALLGLLWNLWGIQGWRVLIHLGIVGAMALLTFFALNPAYWANPLSAARATLNARADLLTQQAGSDPATYSSPVQRVAATLTQPFLDAPQYYEAPTWNGTLDDSIHQYELSPVSGWRWPPFIGAVLTLLSVLGALLLTVQAVRHHDPAARVLLLWLLAAVASSLAVPLGWQRYYLPLFPIAILLVAYVPFAIRLRMKHA